MPEKTKRPIKAAKAVADTATLPSTTHIIETSRAAKPLKTAKAMPAPEAAKEVKTDKPKKEKMVRDSFTMPANDYAQLALIKDRCLKASVNAKKSEVLRAALKCLANLSDVELTKAITDLDFIKTGRPSKN